MLPTYIAIPLITIGFLLIAVLRPILTLLRDEPLAGAAGIVAWLLGVVGMLARSTTELPSLVASVLLALLSQAIAEELTMRLGWRTDIGRVAWVVTVMWILACITQIRAAPKR